MTKGGYIKLYRKIRNHWIWQNPEYLKWWLDLLLLVNHCPQELAINGVVTMIDVGVHHTTEENLAKRWLVNRKTVNKFLNMLEKNKMILVKKSRQTGTMIKVLNYKAYQTFFEEHGDNETDNDTDDKMDDDEATAEQQHEHKQDSKDPDIHIPAESNNVRKIIEHLNLQAGTGFRYNSKTTQDKIKARLNEGFKLDDFIVVIDKKCAEWKGTNMAQYLRPLTLFGNKFEGYLEQPIISSNQQNDKSAQRIDELRRWEPKGDYFDD